MKKLFVSIIMIAFFAVMPAKAQSIHFGVKGGVNNSEFNLDDVPTKSGYGWFVGPTLKVNILSFLGVQGAVLYSQSNSKVDGTNIKQKSILVPIDARLNLHLLPKSQQVRSLVSTRATRTSTSLPRATGMTRW